MLLLLLVTTSLVHSFAFNITEYQDADAGELSDICDDLAQRFEKGYVHYMKTGEETPSLTEVTNQLAQLHSKNIDLHRTEDHSIAEKIFLCSACRAAINITADVFLEGGELSSPNGSAILKDAVLDMCQRFDVFTEEVCDGIFDRIYPVFRFVMDHHQIDSRSFCGTFLQIDFCQVTDLAFNWKLTIDSNGSSFPGPKSKIPGQSENDLFILHISDIHVDLLYEVGSLAECEEPMCCQRYKNISEGTSKAAGYWGDYRQCDTPWHTLKESLNHIKKNHKIDFIYHTGDVIDHGLWLTTVEKNSDTLRRVNALLKAVFEDIPVYSAIGNHESHPLNFFAPSDILDEDLSTKWLYDLVSGLWSNWLPDSTSVTIKKGGYYVASPRHGFKIAVLNNNECYVWNWWMFYNGSYVSEQLKWLHGVLLEAEKHGEYVHILAHVPTGSTLCWTVWSREFGRIVARFSNTISGIFNGHTHRDEFNIYYVNRSIPINIAWNGGSITPFDDKNPNYKYYRVEPTSFQVIEQESWYFNLSSANLTPDVPPKWIEAYTMTKDFGLKDLSPASMDDLLTKFAKDPLFFEKFWEYYVVKGDPLLAKGCEIDCMEKLICRLARGDNTQLDRCKELQFLFHTVLTVRYSGGSSTTTFSPTIFLIFYFMARHFTNY